MDDMKRVCDEHLLPMEGRRKEKKGATEQKTWKKKKVEDEKLYIV